MPAEDPPREPSEPAYEEHKDLPEELPPVPVEEPMQVEEMPME